MLSGFTIDTGFVYADKLLNRGGIMSMAETVLLVFVVFVIAGILQNWILRSTASTSYN